MARPSFDLSDIELSRETQALLPLRASEPALDEQRRFGTWWIAPFARTTDLDLVGFRLIPGRRTADCPVVLASGPASVTIATRADRVVPVVVFAQMASAPRHWIDAAELLDSEWDELRAVHRALGGADDLAALRAIAADPALQASCAQVGPVGAAAAAAVFARLDPSPGRAAIQRALAAGGGAAPAAADAGDWSAALDAMAFAGDPSGDDLAAAWRLFRHPAGLDALWDPAGKALPEPVASDAAARLHRAARRLAARAEAVSGEWRADPLWPALCALAGAATPFDFHGVPFIEAAAVLDERGAAERALQALTAVQFWHFLAGGAPMDGALEAAHALAQRRGWAHLEVISRAVIGAAGEDRESD
jgi:hypothetical protein